MDPDPNPRQNEMDPKRWLKQLGACIELVSYDFIVKKNDSGTRAKNRFNQKHLSILLPPLFSRFWEADKCVTLSNVKHVLLSLF